jgi:hypothetical protein
VSSEENAVGSAGYKIERSALSVSATVAAAIHRAVFRGRVLSCFPVACNLIDEAGCVVSLVTTDVGDGPLNVVVDGEDPFVSVETDMVARIEEDSAIVGDRLVVNLKDTAAWHPVINWGTISAPAMATLWDYVQEGATPESLLTFWVPAIRPLGGVRMVFQETARDAAERLLLALRRGDKAGVVTHALTLAGLGPGGTPAGDDFLIGLMAGLRAWPGFLLPGELSVDNACRLLSQVAIHRTSVFSAAHLRAAQTGQMSEGWHRLAAALAASDEPAIHRAADRLLAVGATSGADAMAGFVAPYLLTPHLYKNVPTTGDP